MMAQLQQLQQEQQQQQDVRACVLTFACLELQALAITAAPWGSTATPVLARLLVLPPGARKKCSLAGATGP